ncbi:MAG: hypothetical protein IH787_04370 [Nitrospirae bacterium]|nr:hypothetical protein [Nitrospirota bacterium]
MNNFMLNKPPPRLQSPSSNLIKDALDPFCHLRLFDLRLQQQRQSRISDRDQLGTDRFRNAFIVI